MFGYNFHFWLIVHNGKCSLDQAIILQWIFSLDSVILDTGAFTGYAAAKEELGNTNNHGLEEWPNSRVISARRSDETIGIPWSCPWM